uniref:Arrestin-like N-terminal domain-containing protein n=1 Tax=Plectus sambesii TaxID=2011161 RepID=A0A914WYR5_9BILA
MSDAVFSRFEIDFDSSKSANSPLVFHGGELLTGNLRIQLKHPLTIHAIKLQFKGRACWLSDASKSGEWPI